MRAHHLQKEVAIHVPFEYDRRINPPIAAPAGMPGPEKQHPQVFPDWKSHAEMGSFEARLPPITRPIAEKPTNRHRKHRAGGVGVAGEWFADRPGTRRRSRVLPGDMRGSGSRGGAVPRQSWHR